MPICGSSNQALALHNVLDDNLSFIGEKVSTETESNEDKGAIHGAYNSAKCREACDFYYVCDHSKSSNMGTNKIMHM